MKNSKQISTLVKETGFKLILFFSFVLMSFISCKNNNEIDYEKRINAIKVAINQKTIDSVRPYLASGFTVKGLPEGMESVILSVMIPKLPSLKKFVINSSKKEKRGTRLIVTFYDVNNGIMKSNFLIANDGKFLEFNLLDNAKISTAVSK
jgi:hypothetical protein